jgi:hypothetical protein
MLPGWRGHEMIDVDAGGPSLHAPGGMLGSS